MKNNLNRREFLQRASASGAALAAAAHGVDAAPSGGTRPNILVIMSDEHTAAIMGCAGNDIVQTPNLDALAGRGVLFDGCYCNSPLCVPSRSSFTSGKYISRVGAWANSCWLPSDDMPSLPRLLNEAGYESLLCGKMHYDATRRYGFKDLGGNMNDHIKTGRGGATPGGRPTSQTGDIEPL